MAFLLPVALLSVGMVSPNGLMIMEGATEAITYAMIVFDVPLLFSVSSLEWMKAMQVVYGLSAACSHGFYAIVSERMSVDVSVRWNGYLRAIVLASHVAASLSGVFVVSADTEESNYGRTLLMILTLFSLILALVFSILIPLTRDEEALADRGDEQPQDEENRIDAASTGSSGLPSTSVWFYVAAWIFSHGVLSMGEGYLSSLYYYRYHQSATDLSGLMDVLGRGAGFAGSLCVSTMAVPHNGGWRGNSNGHSGSLGIGIAGEGASVGIILSSVMGISFGLLSSCALSEHVFLGVWAAAIGCGYSLSTLLTSVIICRKGRVASSLTTASFFCMVFQTVVQIVLSRLFSVNVAWRYCVLSFLCTLPTTILVLSVVLAKKTGPNGSHK